MSNEYFDPTVDDVAVTLRLLELQGGAELDGTFCGSCRTHPTVVFAPVYEELVKGNEVRACIYCDYMHIWERFNDPDMCMQCKKCGGCLTHGCDCDPEEEE